MMAEEPPIKKSNSAAILPPQTAGKYRLNLRNVQRNTLEPKTEREMSGSTPRRALRSARDPPFMQNAIEMSSHLSRNLETEAIRLI